MQVGKFLKFNKVCSTIIWETKVDVNEDHFISQKLLTCLFMAMYKIGFQQTELLAVISGRAITIVESFFPKI